MGVNKVVINTDNGEEVLVNLTNDSVTADTLFDGITAHNKSGDSITGTFTLAEEMSMQDALIAQIAEALEGKTGGSGGGGSDVDDARQIVERTITTYSNKELQTVGTRAFSHCSLLVSVDLPEVTTINSNGFNSCYKLERVVFPKLTTLNSSDQFTYCSALKYADLGLVASLPAWSLANTKVETVILRKTNGICSLKATSGLSGTPIANGTGYVYVPKALVDSYKAAANWSTYANQIRAIEDYPDICGGAE